MSDIRIASRYAKSLIDLSVEHNKLEKTVQDINDLLGTVASSRELMSMLKSPVIRGDKKAVVLEKVFAAGFDPLTSLFVKTIVKKGREAYLVQIAEEFLNQYNELKNITTATVTTAVPVDEATLSAIRAHIESETHKTVQITARVDPKIIGGLVIKMQDNLYDASIAKKLNSIKKELVLN